MIEVRGLTKDFGLIRAVDSISFTVPKGQILGFLGPNGAGKSTTMKILTGFLEPTQGTALIDGLDITEQSIEVRKRLGYLPESAPSYGEMAVCEFLDFIAEIRGFKKSQKKAAAEKMAETCALKEVWYQPIETLSKGYRQRVGFAQALLHDPPVLILDEPTDGLDPNQKHEVRQLIRRMAKDKTIILSTHILEEVEAICSRIIIIAKGKLLADSTPEALRARSSLHGAVTLSIEEDDVDFLVQELATLPEVAHIEKLETRKELRLYPKSSDGFVGKVSDYTRHRQWKVTHLKTEEGRLDEVFRQITLGDKGTSSLEGNA